MPFLEERTSESRDNKWRFIPNRDDEEGSSRLRFTLQATLV